MAEPIGNIGRREWRSEDGLSGGVEYTNVFECEDCSALCCGQDGLRRHAEWHTELARATSDRRIRDIANRAIQFRKVNG